MNTKYETGLKLIEQLHGGHSGGGIVEAFGSISPNMLRMTAEWAFGDVLQNKILDLKTREMLTIASLIPQSLPGGLKAHIESALVAGASKDEIIALIEHLAIYAGFPAASNAMLIAKEVFDKTA
ncbi:MAG TPA: carboxymuconolactone decarboxylase family protein [Gammaproteobacteria bacterium]|nr:carboxymuconolactone decarboxylase family protein [Gammaproteobacteria bacterium]